MKKPLSIVAGLFMCLQVFGQGYTQISCEPIMNGLTGQRAGAPPATTMFRGQLYYAPDGPAPSEASMVTLGLPSYVVNGRWELSGAVTVPATPPGTSAWFQLRVWETSYGSSYGDALIAGPQNGRLALAGTSAMTRLLTTTTPPLVLNSIPGFTLTVVPEPSSLALGALGIIGLFLLRRRN